MSEETAAAPKRRTLTKREKAKRAAARRRKARELAKAEAPPKRGRGRPTVWNRVNAQGETLEQELFRTLDETGCSFEDAAEVIGISYTTLKVREAKDPEFKAKLLRARTKFELWTLKNLADASKAGNVRAMTFWLMTARPEKYNLNRLQFVGKNGESVDPPATPAATVNVAVNVVQELVADREGRQRISALVDLIGERGLRGANSSAVASTASGVRQQPAPGDHVLSGTPPAGNRSSSS